MEPKDFARVVLRRKRTVMTAIVVVVLTAFFGSVRKSPVYAATCEILFQATAYDPTNTSTNPVETVGDLNSNREFLKSMEIASEAAKIMKVPTMPGILDVQLIQDTQIFRLTVVDSESVRAGTACNAYATSYINFKVAEAKKELTRLSEQNLSALREMEKELLRIYEEFARAVRNGDPRQIDLAVQRDTLLKERSDRRQDYEQINNMLRSGINGGGKIIKAAGPGARQGGNLRRDLTLGFLVGLMFGIGIALVREYLDDTVKDKESTQRELGLPVLATLPSDSIDGLSEPSSGVIEAARTLRATLAQLGVPSERNVLVVTSTLAKSRSTTLSSLAGAFAESGRSVLVIGSDLRGARTHEAFGIANTVGLANVARGQVPFEKAIRPAPGLDGVFVLPCGPLIANPGELLSSEEMAMIIRRGRQWADVVLLDAPPVLAAADASVLGAYADGVLLVVSAGQTNRSHANEAKEQLVAAGARVLGAVLVGVDEVGQRSGPGTGYGNGYGEDLPQVLPYGDWNDAYSGYAGGDGYDYGYDAGGDWNNGVLTATARTEPRTGQRRTRPAKKISAASGRDKPTPRRVQPREPVVPRNAKSARRQTSGRDERARTTSPRTSARQAPARSSGTRSGTSRSGNGRTTPARTTPRASNGRSTTGRSTARGTASRASTTARPAARSTAPRPTAKKAPAKRAAKPAAKGTTRRTR